jgi:4-diphosphocytidyl-2-C-methyl-D-erythritol kinase
MDASDPVSVRAFAKINLTLEVLGRRSDGYHEVATVLQTIDLADQLVIGPAPSLRVECNDPSLEGEANLVWRAAVALARSQGILPRARISIQKRIPVGMGLGGGSSDAAAALLALNRLWGLSLSTQQLSSIAAQLGSDVPFFLHGGTALGLGRGEQITPLPSAPPLALTLVCPAATLPGKTAQMYSRLTPAHYTDGSAAQRLVHALDAGAFAPDLLYNGFEAVAFQTFPELAPLRQRLEGLTVAPFRLSGAGPALFCPSAGEQEHRRVVKALQPGGAVAYLVRTVSPRPAIMAGADIPDNRTSGLELRERTDERNR